MQNHLTGGLCFGRGVLVLGSRYLVDTCTSSCWTACEIGVGDVCPFFCAPVADSQRIEFLSYLPPYENGRWRWVATWLALRLLGSREEAYAMGQRCSVEDVSYRMNWTLKLPVLA